MTAKRRPAVLDFDCPRCQHRSHLGSAVAPGRPPIARDGDLSVCFTCGAPLQLSAAGPPRWLTWHEMTALAEDERAMLYHVMAAVLTYRPVVVVTPP